MTTYKIPVFNTSESKKDSDVILCPICGQKHNISKNQLESCLSLDASNHGKLVLNKIKFIDTHKAISTYALTLAEEAKRIQKLIDKRLEEKSDVRVVYGYIDIKKEIIKLAKEFNKIEYEEAVAWGWDKD